MELATLQVINGTALININATSFARRGALVSKVTGFWLEGRISITVTAVATPSLGFV